MEQTRDGRSARAERTRTAIVDALLTLLDEGDVKPTAERVATRAGVSERSVFQHFSDREALFEAAAARQYERVAPKLVAIPRELPLSERIDTFVDQRVRLFDMIAGVRRGAVLIEHESEVVANRLSAVRAAKKTEVVRLFESEIDAVPEPEREALRAALATASAWTAWESLRFHQGLDTETSRAAMRRSLAALLGE